MMVTEAEGYYISDKVFLGCPEKMKAPGILFIILLDTSIALGQHLGGTGDGFYNAVVSLQNTSPDSGH